MRVVHLPNAQDFVPLDTANTLLRMLYIYRYYIIIIVWHMKYIRTYITSLCTSSPTAALLLLLLLQLVAAGAVN